VRLKLAPLLLLVLSRLHDADGLADFAGSGPELRPELFFAGETRGRGVIQTGGGRPSRTFEVVSTGRPQGDTIRVDQTSATATARSTAGFWVLRRNRPEPLRRRAVRRGRPGHARRFQGNALRLRYLLKRPAITMEQWLTCSRTAALCSTSGTVRAFGIVVARLSEQIVRGAALRRDRKTRAPALYRGQELVR
jgi:hypothetical protein